MVPTWDYILLLLFLGFIIGAIGTIVGIGGGPLYVTILFLFILIPLEIAIDTSNFIILITSGIGFIMYLRDRRTNLKISLIFSVFAVIGSFLGLLLLLFITLDEFILEIAFATLLLVVGANMVYKSIRFKIKSKIEPEEKIDFKTNTYLKDINFKSHLKRGIPLFLLAGFASYIFGIGGGIINSPALNLVMDFPIHYATAISTSIVFFTSIFNTISKMLVGQIDYLIGILMGLGSVAGAIGGAKLSNKIPQFYLQLTLAAVLVVFSIWMYLP